MLGVTSGLVEIEHQVLSIPAVLSEHLLSGNNATGQSRAKKSTESLASFRWPLARLQRLQSIDRVQKVVNSEMLDT